MVNKHSTRRKPRSTSRPQNRGTPAPSPARRHRTSTPRARNTALIPQLREIAHSLRGVYSSCITAELALQSQNADRDPEIRRALHMNVSSPVSHEADKLDALLVDLPRPHASSASADKKN